MRSSWQFVGLALMILARGMERKRDMPRYSRVIAEDRGDAAFGCAALGTHGFDDPWAALTMTRNGV